MTDTVHDTEAYNSGTGTAQWAVQADRNQIIAGEGAKIKTPNIWGIESYYDDCSTFLDDIKFYTLSELTTYFNNYIVSHPGSEGFYFTIQGEQVFLNQELLNSFDLTNKFIAILDYNGDPIRFVKSIHDDITEVSHYVAKIQGGKYNDIFLKEDNTYNTSQGAYRSRYSAYKPICLMCMAGNRSYSNFVTINGNYNLSTTQIMGANRLILEGTNANIQIVNSF